MRLGLLGPAAGALDMLRESVEFLVGDAAVDQVIYLGNDDAIERVLAAWAEELFGGEPSEDAFLERVAALAPRGEAGDSARSAVSRPRRRAPWRCSATASCCSSTTRRTSTRTTSPTPTSSSTAVHPPPT
jgi:hypothetical protein